VPKLNLKLQNTIMKEEPN